MRRSSELMMSSPFQVDQPQTFYTRSYITAEVLRCRTTHNRTHPHRDLILSVFTGPFDDLWSVCVCVCVCLCVSISLVCLHAYRFQLPVCSVSVTAALVTLVQPQAATLETQGPLRLTRCAKHHFSTVRTTVRQSGSHFSLSNQAWQSGTV